MATAMPRGYRSATGHHFDKDQTDAIVRTASYHRKDFGLSVIWFPPGERDKVRQSLGTPFRRTSNAGLGSLKRLPPELLHDVVYSLDMQSLFKFRQANSSARQVVDELKKYQLIVSHGLNLLRALLRTGLASDVSLLDFHDAPCTKACTVCGRFGGFMSLLTWKRCYYKCLQEAPELQVLPVATIRKHYHLSRTKSNQLRSIKTLPGIYGMRDSGRNSRTTIASVQQAAFINRQHPRSQPQTYPWSFERDQVFNFMGACALPFYDRRIGKIEHGVSCAGCQLRLENNVDGARSERWAYEARDRVYSEDGFLKHFRRCEQAQLLWESSRDGTHRPSELSNAIRRGTFLQMRG